MAALTIAFESPEYPGNSIPSGRSPIDLAHLFKQTMGDTALEIEVLKLFARQARRAIAEIAECDEEARGQEAHRLKGAALAVGAVAVAEAAAAIEKLPSDASLQTALGAAVLQAELFILKLCR
ncbi:Hpt domain-containing protein [Sinorhizobium medicae]|uniref:Hpt domain protein n=2 Tax=Sinorhizobium medicae TaxID=110321 RepID=A0A508WY95_9HYPH|nr:Hpt domain-containing protein [Sinorhizobium medicae]ABR60379.1 Hpt domain protein [Sinorhizobium medicae WSM419]MBO1940393.1 Hpt domain-containing protein [Sinorhizobium medicae]MBO1962544.1 Hpt domain-containing protein [Sinorhizobium medicae]MDX0413992.1 Hpt domain-containing protein [Sinorhizobium medicae]MDX0425752.1 Hpt domain-containing protein [Sinorhizobium medicae]